MPRGSIVAPIVGTSQGSVVGTEWANDSNSDLVIDKIGRDSFIIEFLPTDCPLMLHALLAIVCQQNSPEPGSFSKAGGGGR